MAKGNALITAERQAIDLIKSELLKSNYPAQIKFIDLLHKATSKNAELKKHNIQFISIESYEVVELSGMILAHYKSYQLIIVKTISMILLLPLYLDTQ